MAMLTSCTHGTVAAITHDRDCEMLPVGRLASMKSMARGHPGTWTSNGGGACAGACLLDSSEASEMSEPYM